MAKSTVFCGACKVPLNSEEQFLGHQILSHELKIEEARLEWLQTSETFGGFLRM